MSVYVGVNGIARKVSKIYVGDSNGIAREVKAGYVGVNGVARKVHSSGPIQKPVSVQMVYWGNKTTSQQGGISVKAASHPTTISKGPNTGVSYNPASGFTICDTRKNTRAGYVSLTSGYTINSFNITSGIDSESAPWEMSFVVWMDVIVDFTQEYGSSDVVITWNGSTVTTKVENVTRTGSNPFFSVNKTVGVSYNNQSTQYLYYLAQVNITNFKFKYT